MSGESSWSVELLTETEPGRRNRRTADSILVLFASIVVGLSAAVAASAEDLDEEVAGAVVTLLGWAEGLWRASFVSALALALLVSVAVVWRRRWDLVRDLVIALLCVWAAATVLSGAVHADWLPVEPHLLSRWGFPELRIALATATLAVLGPELVRRVRILAAVLISLALIGAVALGTALPSDAFGALALGLGMAALVRLAFGTAAGVPRAADVRRSLASLGVKTRALEAAAAQRMGAATYVAELPDGAPLQVRVLGRDAQDTQWVARRWRALAYRDPSRSVPVGRREQVEHEALATLMAARAGVRVPEVVIAAGGPDGDAIIATRQPDVRPLEDMAEDEVSDDALKELWEQVSRLHAAGISHGRLNARNVLLLREGPMLIDFSAATLGAAQSALDMDVAELLVACAILVGPERGLDEAVAAGWGEAIARVLPYLQEAALTPHLRDLARSNGVRLKALRTAAAAASGQEVPELAPLLRVRFKNVLLTAALVFAAYLLITQLADIGFDTIVDQLREANPAWILVALLLAQSTFIGNGISVRGAVVAPLPLLPCVVLQSAMKFINLTVPSSAGRIGLNLRFLQRLGVPVPQALAAGAIDDASNTIVQLALFLIAIPLVQVRVDIGQFGGAGPDTRLLIAIGVVLLVSLLVILLVPKVRARVLPPIHSALAGLWAVTRDRKKRLELYGGTAASELLYAISLGATCLAFGVHLNLAQLVFVNTAASVLSGLVPVPGGIGAAEASLSAGLIAMGVAEPTAFAIAITQRLCTFYLPPIWGYVSLQWLSRNGYL